jgi:hypothetical protein
MDVTAIKRQHNNDNSVAEGTTLTDGAAFGALKTKADQ